MANLQTVVVNPGFYIQDTQVNLHGTGDSIPATNSLRIAISTTPGGPYTAWIGPCSPGTGAIGQPVQNVFGCNTSLPKLTPSTQYYYVVQETDSACTTVLNTSPEATFTTKAASDYLQCDPTVQHFQTRNHVFSTLIDSLEAPCDGSLVTKEYSTSALGPWTVAKDSNFNASGPCTFFPNPQGFIGVSTSIVATDTNGLLHNTDYYIRYTLQKGNGDPSETQVCGPFRTDDYPVYSCSAAFNITPTSGDVNYSYAIIGASGGSPWANNQPVGCNQDSFTLRWGTTPGGPYPNSVGPVVGVQSPGFNLTGLTTGVPVYYVMEASEQLETAGIYQTTPECTFTPGAAPPPPSATANPATGVTSTSANTNGTINNPPAGGFWEIHLGPSGGPYTTVLCPNTPVSGANPENVTCAAPALTPNTQYCYVVVLKDSGLNVVATSPAEACFTTPAVVTPATADCNPATGIVSNGATLNGTLHNATPGDLYNFQFGTTPGGPYPISTGPQGTSVGGANEPISQPSGALSPGTTYYFRTRLATSGNVDKVFSGECTFSTPLGPNGACVAANNIDSNSADLQVLISASNFPGWTYTIEYGTTNGGPYPTVLGPFAITSDPQGESRPTGNVLTPGTNYYWHVIVRDNLNTVQSTSSQCTFVTDAPPTAVSNPATAITDTTALGHGTVTNTNPGDTWEIAIGPSGGPYVVQCGPTAVSGANPEAVSCPFTGLTPNTQYCYTTTLRDSGSNILATSTQVCFTTAPPPPFVDPCEPATNITFSTATLHATAVNVPAGYSYRFRWGTTPGGPYPNIVSGGPSNGISPQSYTGAATGLPPNSFIYYISEVLNSSNVVVASSPAECQFATQPFPLFDCGPTLNVTGTTASIGYNDQFVPAGFTIEFKYGTGTPDHSAGPVVASGASPDQGTVPISGLTPSTHYCYTAYLYDAQHNLVTTSSQCCFDTAFEYVWCGGYHTPGQCSFVDPGNGQPYFNCNDGV